MKRFGFGNKSEKGDAEHDSMRSGLFGRGKKSSPAPQSDNPYAAEPAGNPYANMTPYQQAKAALPGGPNGDRSGLPSGSGGRAGSSGPPPPYSSSGSSSGYRPEKVGASGAYGGNRYDNDANSLGGNNNRQSPMGSSANPYARGPSNGGPAGGAYGSQASSRPGGYGGMGPADDENRDALFGGAQRQAAQLPSQPQGQNNTYGASGGYGGGNSYDNYGEQRELTEEERENLEVKDIYNQIESTQDESLASLNRSRDLVRGAIATGSQTLAMMGTQADRLANTDRNLDMAAIHNRRAEDQVAELKTANRSMFAMHVNKPFSGKKRQEKRDIETMARHHADRAAHEATQQNAYKQNQRMEQHFKEIEGKKFLGGAAKSRADKFAFDAGDEEQNDRLDRREAEIDEGLRGLEDDVGMLKRLAKAQGVEADASLKHIEGITEKSDLVNDHLAKNIGRLNYISKKAG